ncbi:hypothetical protein [Methylocystis bryophila]|uniref:Uncharacterized protein n=1 Tax=Methylocystis bryophila TaxID=655015 RepID=A0A1W6N2D7_9HYPH|nr:hypothetical protein [Methylocystis bryophila]ARN83936.1 hypothetical protein B1812_21940 [Methylocystis bryophila]BDV41062.1 hypothetical protein DSM21852_43160 [Methylocystis bryophila]
MRHRLFPFAVSFLAGVVPALAQTPVIDVAREATEKSIADCMTKARVYKDGTLQPSKGITGSLQTSGQGQLPSAGGALLSANNVTAPSTGVVSNMDLSAVQTTVAGSGTSVTALNLNTVAQTVAALGAVANGIQGNRNNTQIASAIIGALALSQSAWNQNSSARSNNGGMWNQAIMVTSLTAQLFNQRGLNLIAGASRAANALTFDASKATLIGLPD